MKSKSKFNTGHGVFKCDSCGHNTRLNSDVDGLCTHCYEIASIDNYFNDNDREHTSTAAVSFMADAEAHLAAIRKVAGDAAADRVKSGSDFVWPPVVKADKLSTLAAVVQLIRKELRKTDEHRGWQLGFFGNILTLTCNANHNPTYASVIDAVKIVEEHINVSARGDRRCFSYNETYSVLVNWIH